MAIVEFIIDLLKQIGSLIAGFAGWLWEKFTDISLFEKIIIITFIPAFFAVILPIAKFWIFGGFYYVNNPLAVYLIGIVAVMYITHLFPGTISFAVREGLNAYYLFWVIYLQATGEIVKTSYNITFGYYFNLLVPVLFMVFSALSWLEIRD